MATGVPFPVAGGFFLNMETDGRDWDAVSNQTQEERVKCSCRISSLSICNDWRHISAHLEPQDKNVQSDILQACNLEL